MNYRIATQEDLSVLLQFGKELSLVESKYDETIVYEDTEARSRYIKQLSKPFALFLISETEEKLPTGYLYAHIDTSSQQGELEVVFISEEYRGQGLAQELVTRALEWMKGKQVFRVVTHIFAGNQSSQKAFEKLGFKPHNIEYLLKIQ